MSEVLRKLIAGELVIDNDLEDELYEICDRVHASCHDECPIYQKFGDVPWTDDLSNCKYFKNGEKMLAELRK